MRRQPFPGRSSAIKKVHGPNLCDQLSEAGGPGMEFVDITVAERVSLRHVSRKYRETGVPLVPLFGTWVLGSPSLHSSINQPIASKPRDSPPTPIPAADLKPKTGNQKLRTLKPDRAGNSARKLVNRVLRAFPCVIRYWLAWCSAAFCAKTCSQIFLRGLAPALGSERVFAYVRHRYQDQHVRSAEPPCDINGE